MLMCCTMYRVGACDAWTESSRWGTRKGRRWCAPRKGKRSCTFSPLVIWTKLPLRSQETESCSRSTFMWEKNTRHASAYVWLQVPCRSLSQPCLMMWPLGGVTPCFWKQCCPGQCWSGLPQLPFLLCAAPVKQPPAIWKFSMAFHLLNSFTFLMVTQLCCKLPNTWLKQIIWVIPPMLISVICGMHTTSTWTGPPLCCTVFAGTGITQDNWIWNNQSRKQQ